MSPSTSSQSVARPVRACFQRRDHILGEIPAAQQAIKTRDTRLHTAEPAARRSDQRGDDIITEALAQCGSQVADPVGQAELDRGVAGPVLPGEQGSFWALEPRATASLDQVDEALVDLTLHRLELLNVLWVLRQERVEHGLVLAGRIEPALDAELVHELGKTERAADHADGTDDRGRIANDLVRGAGDHVAARRRDILGKSDYGSFVLSREFADAAVDQMRLHR